MISAEDLRMTLPDYKDKWDKFQKEMETIEKLIVENKEARKLEYQLPEDAYVPDYMMYLEQHQYEVKRNDQTITIEW